MSVEPRWTCFSNSSLRSSLSVRSRAVALIAVIAGWIFSAFLVTHCWGDMLSAGGCDLKRGESLCIAKLFTRSLPSTLLPFLSISVNTTAHSVDTGISLRRFRHGARRGEVLGSTRGSG